MNASFPSAFVCLLTEITIILLVSRSNPIGDHRPLNIAVLITAARTSLFPSKNFFTRSAIRLYLLAKYLTPIFYLRQWKAGVGTVVYIIKLNPKQLSALPQTKEPGKLVCQSFAGKLL